MNENQELIRDYMDCIKYLKELDNYDYEKLSSWASIKYGNWISKDEKYALSFTGGSIPPRSNREGAVNSLSNLKVTLEKIALIKDLKI